jgi:hypothetical protein
MEQKVSFLKNPAFVSFSGLIVQLNVYSRVEVTVIIACFKFSCMFTASANDEEPSDDVERREMK